MFDRITTMDRNSFMVISLIVLFLSAVTGCTTMKEVNHQNVDLENYLDIGDHIVVYEKSGRIIDMRFVIIEGTTMRGSYIDDGLEPVEVELDQIERIETEKIAAGRTIAAVLGGIVLAPLAAIGAGVGLAEM